MDILSTFFSENLKRLWISTGFILFTIGVFEALRLFINYTFKAQCLTKQVLSEIIAVGDQCACCFELCILADEYGMCVYSIFVFSLCVWWSLRWRDEASACPYTYIEDLLEGQSTIKNVLLIIIFQLIVAMGIYPFYVKKFWLKLETEMDDLTNECFADLKVSVVEGAVIEGFAVCITQLMGRIMSHFNPKYANIFTAFVGTTLEVAAFEFSGGYLNPVLATSLQFNCVGVSLIEHFIVYWLGAIVGSIFSVILWKLFNLTSSLPPNIQQKTK